MLARCSDVLIGVVIGGEKSQMEVVLEWQKKVILLMKWQAKSTEREVKNKKKNKKMKEIRKK